MKARENRESDQSECRDLMPVDQSEGRDLLSVKRGDDAVSQPADDGSRTTSSCQDYSPGGTADYDEEYKTLNSIGKGAFGFVKIGERKSDGVKVWHTDFAAQLLPIMAKAVKIW